MAVKKRPFRKFIVIAAVLVVVELALILLYSSGDKGDSFVAAMNNQIADDGRIPPEKRTLVKLQLALNDFRVKHGQWPQKLAELVPLYFDRVPIDPETGAAFKYTVEKNRYFLGDRKTKPAQQAGSKDLQSASEAERDALVASLDKKGEEEAFVYDPQGKRDPFRSHDFSPKDRGDHTGHPLEKYSYDELTLTAVLKGLDQPKAIIENPLGKGFSVTIGDPVGSSGGKVASIEEDKIIILETTVEFTGEKRTRTVEMYLR